MKDDAIFYIASLMVICALFFSINKCNSASERYYLAKIHVESCNGAVDTIVETVYNAEYPVEIRTRNRAVPELVAVPGWINRGRAVYLNACKFRVISIEQIKK